MRREASVFAACATACALVHCSLLTDTGGLTGGRTDVDASNTIDGFSEAANGPTEAASEGSAPEAAVDASSLALGPLWLAYGTIAGRIGVRRWREDMGAWSAELPGPDVGVGIVRWVVPKETPVGSFLAVVTSAPAGGRLDVFERAADGTWLLGFTTPFISPTRRGFDIEYETATNAILVVYADATAAPKFRRRTASGWSAEIAAPSIGTLPPAWVELARSPVKNEIALVYVDDGVNLEANFWDGTTWGTTQELDANVNTRDFKAFDAVYDSANGTLLAAWGHAAGTADGGVVQDMRFTSHAAGGPFDAVKITNDGKPPGPIVLAPEPGSSRIAVSYLEYNCNKIDVGCDDYATAIWTGSSFIANLSLDGDTTTLYHGRPSTMPTGVAWLGTTGVAIAAYHRDLAANAGLLPFTRFGGGAWAPVSGADAAPPMPPRASMQLVTAPGPTVVAVVEDTNGGLWSKGYRETGGMATWSDVGGGATLATSLVTASGVPFGVTTP